MILVSVKKETENRPLSPSNLAQFQRKSRKTLCEQKIAGKFHPRIWKKYLLHVVYYVVDGIFRSLHPIVGNKDAVW